MSRQSKRRREAREKQAAARLQQQSAAARPDTPNQGVGGPESPRDVATAKEENRLAGAAIGHRWGTTERHKQAAIGVTIRNMGSDDGRVSNGAVKNLIAIESQNQKDEHTEQSRIFGQPGSNVAAVQVNINGAPVTHEGSSTIEIVRRKDFYGNDAHDADAATHLADAAATSIEGSAITGTVQDADLRAKVGKNGHGTNGHAGGSRNGTGGLNGSH